MAPYAAYYLGLHYLNEGDHKRSVVLFRRMLSDYRDFPLKADLTYRLAAAYKEIGRKDDAKECLRGLISKEPYHLLARRAKNVLRELK